MRCLAGAEWRLIREAPRLEQDAELSQQDEARLYAHYGVEYGTVESASGLPAGETSSATAGTDATTQLPPSTRLEADVPAAGRLSATGSTRAAGTAARKAVQAGQQAATSGRMAVHKARQEVAAVVDAIETTPESKRKARKRARARKRAMAAAAGAARSVAAALAAAWRRVRKSESSSAPRSVTSSGQGGPGALRADDHQHSPAARQVEPPQLP